ncbi:hypothetical protein G3M48_010563 [Beauveria asiatica]|uniref:Uncharacterized protein n=1 Tax=Beauveria asiatica TaxID=1069075 RepID=A0AAW0S1Q1_9HYPO
MAVSELPDRRRGFHVLNDERKEAVGGHVAADDSSTPAITVLRQNAGRLYVEDSDEDVC